MSLTIDFYLAASKLVSKMNEIPGELKSLIYDPRFTSEEIIEEIKHGDDPFALDVPRYYHSLFTDLSNTVRYFNCFSYVCDSDDINEDIERGDFLYYAGPIATGIGVLLMEPTHPFCYPYRAYIYGSQYQFEVGQDRIPILVFPVAEAIRDMILNPNEKERIRSVRKYLEETDRPYVFIDE